MREKLKPGQDLESVQADLIETVCYEYNSGSSIRAVAKKFDLSPMKVRKILITGGVYSTDMSTEIGELYKDGKKPAEIAEMLNTTTANVNSYLPYERIVYNMEERSVEADRQARYRDRKKGLLPAVPEKEEVKVERIRTETMIFVIGKKLRKMIPEGVLDNSSDPLARDHSYTWGSNITGEFVLHEPADSDKSIWCAELTTAGRGARRKSGIVLMSANCGFAVITSLPPIPTTCSSDELEQMSWEDRRRVEQENKEKMRTYRAELEAVFMNAIRAGLLSFSLPENRVLDYTDTVARIELVKGRMSTAAVRLEELIERELKWENGDDPIKQFNIRGNWTSRKYGNSGDYRHVDAAVQQMLGMNTEESAQWLMGFLAPMREKMTAGEM